MTPPSKTFRAQLSAEELNERENRVDTVLAWLQLAIIVVILGGLIGLIAASVRQALAVMP